MLKKTNILKNNKMFDKMSDNDHIKLDNIEI